MITVTPVLISLLPNGRPLATLELEYPRFIHAEFMTHRMFSRNAQSSRAVPASKLSDLPTVYPLVWGKNKAGMQSAGELKGWRETAANIAWAFGDVTARMTTKILAELGVHKQWANRPVEPYTSIKVIVTSTEWENFFNLRDHSAAQPEIQLLAKKIKDVLRNSPRQHLAAGQWHVPYVISNWLGSLTEAGAQYFLHEGKSISLREALMISASCCAQVSFRKLDTSWEKAQDVWEKLQLNSLVPRASPTEHQAMALPTYPPVGIDSLLRKFPHLHVQFPKDPNILPNYFSGNLCGAIQHRHNLLGEVKL